MQAARTLARTTRKPQAKTRPPALILLRAALWGVLASLGLVVLYAVALRQGWLESRRHLPAARFGPLTALDDSLIRPHTGFNTHPDKNEVLLYYIANGELTHGDSLNNHSVLRRGEALCLHTGTGLRHSELNQSSAPLRLVRMAFSPARPGGAPNYGEQRFLWENQSL